MSTNLTGWIEINTVKESTENLWFKVIDLDIIAEQNYNFYGQLFGVRNTDNLTPTTASRGLPQDIPQYSATQFDSETIVGITWANFNEIENKLEQLCCDSPLPGWLFILESGRMLANRYEAKNVRFIVGFDNYG